MAPLVRALALLQRYPVALLLPAVAAMLVTTAIHRALFSLPLPKFGHFLIVIVGLFIAFLLGCLSFLCVANYVVRSESNSETPKIRNIFDSLAYPGFARLLSGLLTRFALALVIAGALTVLAVGAGFAILKVSTHHPVPRSVSGPAYLWVATAAAIIVLSRWVMAIPLFVQSQGLLKQVFATSAKSIHGRRTLAVVLTLLTQAMSYPLLLLTSPLHPHLSQGAARYVPQLAEIIAAHGFQVVLWTWWMIVMTMLAMRLQGHDEPSLATPLAAA